ncbi:MAG: hypothetical protein AAFU03_18500, partial [Bacteroidota bacterium]
MTDKELIALIQKGGQSENLAFSFLVKQLSYQNLARTAASKIPNGLAQLFEQDVFLHGLAVLCDSIRSGIFRGESSLLTYFGSICFRSARDLIGRQPIHNSEEVLMYIEDDHWPDFQLMEESRKQEVWQLFNHICEKIDEKHGKILKMKLKSYPNDRIATELDLPYATVK